MSKYKQINEPALMYFEFKSIGKEAISVFSIDSIENELLSLAGKLELSLDTNVDIDISEYDWHTIISDFLQHLGASSEIDTYTILSLQNDLQVQTLSFRFQQALKSLKLARYYVDEKGLATGLLLPISFAKRIELLIALAQLPLAWVRVLDIHSIQP